MFWAGLVVGITLAFGTISVGILIGAGGRSAPVEEPDDN